MKTPETNRIYVGDCVESMKEWPDACVDAVVTDPPYGIRFMGKAWDGADIDAMVESKKRKGTPMTGAKAGTRTHEGRAFAAGTYDLAPEAMKNFQMWTAAWAVEALRILKPGGHLLAFASSRTYHRMAAGVEDAGFEIRDQALWLYGQGFPKSLNVSMQLDKMDSVETRRERALRFTAWMRASGIKSSKVNELTASNMGGHYMTDKEQPEVATAEMFDKLRPHLPEVPEEIEELVRWRTVESENFKRRKVTGTKIAVDPAKARLGVPGRDAAGKPLGGTKEIQLTEAHTELAKKWEGWGTALKPAHEPIVVARKPLDGNVADNVMAWGTGALNIDAARIPILDETPIDGEDNDKGRWPANLFVMHHAHCYEVQPPTWACVPACPMRQMEIQTSGSTKFFYVPKPSAGERNMGLDEAEGNFHPTVKPVDLMTYLIKLVTPRGGVVLDPFLGSGTTAIAAARLGHPWLGCELGADHAELAEKRIAAETEQGKLF